MSSSAYPFPDDLILVGDTGQGMEMTIEVQVNPTYTTTLRLIGGRFFRPWGKDILRDQVEVTLDAANGRRDEYGDPIENLAMRFIGVRLDNSVLGDRDPGLSLRGYLRSMIHHDVDFYTRDLAGDPGPAEQTSIGDLCLPAVIHYQPIYRYALRGPDGTISQIGYTEPDSKPTGHEYVWSAGGSDWKAL